MEYPGSVPTLGSVHVDSRQVAHMAKLFRALPKTIRDEVVSKALSRVASQIGTRVVRHTAERIGLQQKLVRRAVSTRYIKSQEAIVVRMLSGWVPLSEIGARQTRRGVTVRGRGAYPGAFIATVRTAGTTGRHGGHEGVFKRKPGAGRLPIRQLFGPNPAHDLLRNGDDYVGVALDGIDDLIMPRILHELNRALTKALVSRV